MNHPLLEILSKAASVGLIADGIALPWTFPASTLTPLVAAMVPPTNVFTRQGQIWRLRYDGVETLLPHSVGLGYIGELVQHQGKFIHATELVSRLNGEAVDCVSDGQLQDGEDEPGQLSAASEFRDELLPDKDRRWLLRVLGLKQEEYERLRAKGRPDAAAELKDEIDRTKADLKKHRHRNHNATFVSRSDRDRKSVTAAIRRATERVEKVHPSLARHLAKAIETGSQCRYLPEKEVRWPL
jgi:hypothetical protein